jgi:cytochrome d ubiquinol oxidase subunit II
VFDGLTSRALPIVILSALCGVGSLVLLLRRFHRGARLLAAGAVATVVIAWGVAQWPYLLPTSEKVAAGAAPDATLQAVLLVFAIAAVVVLPSLALLFVLDQKGLLPGEGTEQPEPSEA